MLNVAKDSTVLRVIIPLAEPDVDAAGSAFGVRLVDPSLWCDTSCWQSETVQAVAISAALHTLKTPALWTMLAKCIRMFIMRMHLYLGVNRFVEENAAVIIL